MEENLATVQNRVATHRQSRLVTQKMFRCRKAALDQVVQPARVLVKGAVAKVEQERKSRYSRFHVMRTTKNQGLRCIKSPEVFQ